MYYERYENIQFVIIIIIIIGLLMRAHVCVPAAATTANESGAFKTIKLLIYALECVEDY